jgi:hypothetical protein
MNTDTGADASVLKFRSGTGRTELTRRPDGTFMLNVLYGHDQLTAAEGTTLATALGEARQETRAPSQLPTTLTCRTTYPAMARYRWVLGKTSVKCDQDDAVRHRATFGGRVDRSWVVPYVDGGERIGGWVTVLPHIDPPTGSDVPRSSQPANPQEAPTRAGIDQ